MPNQTRRESQLNNQDVEKKRLPQEYFVEKSQTGNQDGDVHLQESIWSFLKSVPELDIYEVEIDVDDGVVTVNGTFPTVQLQGRIVHTIMNLGGVRRVVDETHVLHKHQLKNTPDEGNI